MFSRQYSDLPPGLSEGQEVTLVGPYGLSFTVRDDEGNEFRVSHLNGVSDAEYLLDNGQWVPWHHPEVLSYYRRELDHLESTRDKWTSGIEYINEELIAKAKYILSRPLPQ